MNPTEIESNVTQIKFAAIVNLYIRFTMAGYPAMEFAQRVTSRRIHVANDNIVSGRI